MEQQRATVRDRQGVEAVISGEIVDPKRVMIELQNGRKLLVPRSAFLWDADTGYSVPFTFDGLEEVTEEAQGFVVPVVREEAILERELKETAVVHIEKRVEEREEVVNATATINEADIERIQINEFVEQAPGIRYEGDTMVIPLMEEVLVVEKRLLLREEIRITQISREEPRQEKVVLRSEYAEAHRSSRSESHDHHSSDHQTFEPHAVDVVESVEEPIVEKAPRTIEQIVVARKSAD